MKGREDSGLTSANMQWWNRGRASKGEDRGTKMGGKPGESGTA